MAWPGEQEKNAQIGGAGARPHKHLRAMQKHLDSMMATGDEASAWARPRDMPE